MERLTKRNDKGIAVLNIRCPEGCEHVTCSPEEGYQCQHQCEGDIINKLAAYEDAEEQGLRLRVPCQVGDPVYLIDRDENNKFKVYEGKWECVSLVQTSKDGPFKLRGEISYDIYDCFYDDGRTMKHGMYVGQESTRIGEVVFLTKEAAEAKLKEMSCFQNGNN